MRRCWTEEEDRVLLRGAGAFALAYFAKRVGPSHTFPGAPKRSTRAMYHRAKRLWGAGGFTRGVYSIHQLTQQSGYSRGALKRAQKALNHSYKRLTPRGPYLITYDQKEDLFAWLAHDYWCKALRRYNCVWCAENVRPHKGAGLCTRCYFRLYRRCHLAGISTDPEKMRQLPMIVQRSCAVSMRRMAAGLAPAEDVLRGLPKGAGVDAA